MKNDRFRKDADLLLSGLQWTQADTKSVLSALKGEQPKMKRKMSLGLVLALVFVLLAAAALAAGLIFSPKVEAANLAYDALEKQYGITPAMQTVFDRSMTASDDDQTKVITLQSVEPQWADQIGVYTVTVHGQKAQAVWSHDDEPMTDGLDSPVWGAQQIGVIISDYAAACAAVHADELPQATPDPAVLAANEAQWEKNEAEARSRAKLTLEECRQIAVESISQVYKLTADQRAALRTEDDESCVNYTMQDGDPAIVLVYMLTQDESGSFTDGDGQYTVTINAETGVIENILYDSGLASNG